MHLFSRCGIAGQQRSHLLAFADEPVQISAVVLLTAQRIIVNKLSLGIDRVQHGLMQQPEIGRIKRSTAVT
ncbi:hypothetical protein D3C81_2091020 [compost metagenome]